MSQPKSWDVYDEYFYIHSIETPVTLKCIVITHQGVVHEGLTVFNFMGKSNYSRDLNIGLVWYSNDQKFYDRRMVWYLNAI